MRATTLIASCVKAGAGAADQTVAAAGTPAAAGADFSAAGAGAFASFVGAAAAAAGSAAYLLFASATGSAFWSFAAKDSFNFLVTAFSAASACAAGVLEDGCSFFRSIESIAFRL